MEIHSQLHTLDLVVIAVYAVLVIGLGMWVSYRHRASNDLFLADRSFGWPNLGLSLFATNVNPAFMIGMCSVAYTSGMVAANYEWLAWVFLLLLAMVFVPYYLTTKVSTMPEFMQRRFGTATYQFVSWYTLFATMILWLGGSLYTGSILLSQIMNWPLWVAAVVLAAVATSFTVAGGLAAVVITDAFQAILMLGGALALTVIAFLEIGSVESVVNSVPEDYWKIIRPHDSPDFPWPAMFLGYPVLGIWFWCTDQTVVQRVLGARNVRQAQLACVFTGFLKILPPFIFMLPGIFCYILHPGLTDPDQAFATMVVNHLPVGMTGLIVAVLIAALVSTLDSGLNSFSTVFTLDIYIKYFRPDATPKQTKWIGRVITLLVGALSVAIALGLDTVGRDLFNLLQGVIAFLAPPMAAVFLIGVLWKRATATAAFWTLGLGSIVSLACGICHLKNWPNEVFWPHYLLLSFYLFVGISTFMILVSLWTRHSSEEQPLATLTETYSRQDSSAGLVWALWGLLAAIMLGIYIVL